MTGFRPTAARSRAQSDEMRISPLRHTISERAANSSHMPGGGGLQATSLRDRPGKSGETAAVYATCLSGGLRYMPFGGVSTL